MPLAPHKSNLDPETTKAALEAFDIAYAIIMARPDYHDTVVARELLVSRIIGAAIEHDECDPEQLKNYALAGFNP